MAQQVALVQMPIAMPRHPSLGLSLLKAGLTRAGLVSRVYYPNLRFAEAFEQNFYLNLNYGLPSLLALVGDWIFAEALWGTDQERDRAYIENVLRHPASEETFLYGSASVDEEMIEQILQARRMATPFIEQCLAEIPWQDFDVVGFTSVFQQHIASLALAKRIKARFPQVRIVFGGPNCEGPMSIPLIRNFSCVDAVVSGEADAVFPALVERVFAGKPVDDLPGVVTRANVGTFQGTAPIAPAITNMDDLPYPDYDDYFAALAESGIAEDPQVRPYLRLPFETSRGCWWGQKTHCTFCGLNGSTVSFRYKSADRALRELHWLLERYGDRTRTMMVVDNIMPYEYMKTFLPQVKDEELDTELFYEVKSNLREEQVRLLREAGILTIQPGIESLSTPVLRLMHKGVTGLQNVQLLKWCRQYDVIPRWNHLMALPGETAKDYEHLPEMIRAITHLQPPGDILPIRFVRFSPYMDHPNQFNIRSVRPQPAYAYIYPGMTDADVMASAIYFAVEYDWPEERLATLRKTAEAIHAWTTQSAEAAMFSVRLPDRVVVVDLRHRDIQVHDLQGGQAVIHEACEAIASLRALEKVVEQKLGALEVAKVGAWVAELVDKGLLLREGDSVLAVAVPLGYRYSPPAAALKRFQEYLDRLRTPEQRRSQSVVIGSAGQSGRAFDENRPQERGM